MLNLKEKIELCKELSKQTYISLQVVPNINSLTITPFSVQNGLFYFSIIVTHSIIRSRNELDFSKLPKPDKLFQAFVSAIERCDTSELESFGCVSFMVSLDLIGPISSYKSITTILFNIPT